MPQINDLLKNPQLWRSARSNAAARQSSVSSGQRALDQALHSRGWPVAGSTELLCDQAGIGELSLLLPALARLSQQQTVAWLNPPFLPYAPALQQASVRLENCLFIRTHSLQDHLWAGEELLRSGACGAVLQWSGNCNLTDKDLRRLQLAAREHQCWHIHLRASNRRQQSSPAPLRLCLSSTKHALALVISKQAGGPAGQQLEIPRDAALLHQQNNVQHWPTQTTPAPDSPPKRPLLMSQPFSRFKTTSTGVELH